LIATIFLLDFQVFYLSEKRMLQRFGEYTYCRWKQNWNICEADNWSD